MSRSLTVLFRRDPSKDKEAENIRYEGYEPYWPDGRAVDVGLEAFCKHGQRLLGLGKHLAGLSERLIKVVFMPLSGREDNLTRIPGYRVRRFFIERTGNTGLIYFMDGTPTTIDFAIGRDEAKVLHWVGLPSMKDGERQWFDLAAMPLDAVVAIPRQRLATADA